MLMFSRTMKALAVAYSLVTLLGCASHGDVVRCGGRLEPINLPTPRAAKALESDSSTERDKTEAGS